MEKEIIADCLMAFNSAYDALKREMSKIRTGRANPALLDGIRVEYYGASTPLSQMAAVQIPDARLLVVKPWDKSSLSSIEKAISESDLGITPQNDGEMIRLPIPALTQERRKEYVKLAKNKGEDAKIAIRNARRDANELFKGLQKDGDLSEDDVKKCLEKVQQETDKAIGIVDDVLAKKEKEILEI